MARKTIRRLLEGTIGSEWDQLVRRIRRRHARRFLLFWNRGLGDIALGLHRVVAEIRQCVPDADITILTRAELADACVLIPIDHVLVDPDLRRGDCTAEVALARIGVKSDEFDMVLSRMDPTHWFRGRPTVMPRLHWPARFDALAARFDPWLSISHPPTIDIAVHVSSETAGFYKYRKDWPLESWRALFLQVQARYPVRFILLGLHADGGFPGIDCVDLRGKTTFLEMMAVIRQRCAMLIAPDSGVLTATYFLDGDAPIELVSLWADPRQGILKQASPSPNPNLRHRAVLAPDERIENITVDSIAAAIESALEGLAASTRSRLEPTCELA
jgi:ADP-heptose:LPS heptosyltransferase